MLTQIASTISKDKVAEFCKRNHIVKFSIFGSVLRDDFRADSDVDVLVEFEKGRVPGLAFFGMQDDLSKLIGRKVDLHTPRSISKYYRDQVFKEAQTVYA
ncbi:MAG: nucleotidyltransferase family protein [Chloroflexota bacterium]